MEIELIRQKISLAQTTRNGNKVSPVNRTLKHEPKVGSAHMVIWIRLRLESRMHCAFVPTQDREYYSLPDNSLQ